MRSLSSLVCIASVGCYTQPTSDFARLERPPVVRIDAPTDGAGHPVGEPIALEGRAADPEGLGDIATLEWRSDIDGVLATIEDAPLEADGVTRFSTALSEGVHAITLEVEDIEGLAAVHAITVTVEPAD